MLNGVPWNRQIRKKLQIYDSLPKSFVAYVGGNGFFKEIGEILKIEKLRTRR